MNDGPRPPTPDLDRLQVDPGVMGGKPVVRDTRVPVSVILNVMAHGYTPERVVEAYPSLALDDVRAALYLASLVVGGGPTRYDPIDHDPAYREWLRAELQPGLDDVARGDLVDFTPDLRDRLSRESDEHARQGTPIREAVLPPRRP